MSVVPNNKLNATIRSIIEHAQASIEEIARLEQYFKNYERSESEQQRLSELVRLKEQLSQISSIPYYKPGIPPELR